MRLRSLAPAIPLLAGLGLLSCSEPNPFKIERARLAVTAAESQDAAKWAPEELAEAKEAMAAAEKEFDRVGLFRGPEEAYALADEAKRLAEEATRKAEDAYQETMRETRRALDEAETALLTAEGSFASLVRCHREKTPVPEIRSLAEKLKQLKAQQSEVSAHFEKGALEAATDEARHLAESAASFNERAEHVEVNRCL